MADGREISAWIAASRMSGCNYLFVEGVADERFWKRFVDKDSIHIQQLKGWQNVIECVKSFNAASMHNSCIGVIDRDFENLFPNKNIIEDNIFLTDHHDIEMMMYTSPAWDFALKTIDKKNRISVSSQDILSSIFDITDRIGYLKLLSIKDELGLIFKKYDKNHEIELPKYEKAISNSGEYVGDDKLINYIYSFTNSNSQKSLPKIETIISAFNELCKENFPSEHLSNGHDITYVLVYILKRKYRLNESYITVDTIDIALTSAYSAEIFKQSELFRLMSDWCEKNSKHIFVKELFNTPN